MNPSAENMAKYFFEEVSRELKEMPPGAEVKEVVIWETDTASAKYYAPR